MKPYSQLGTVELVEANLAGEYDGMKIAPDIVRQNLQRLELPLAKVIEENEPTYKQVKGQACRVARDVVKDFIRYVEHLYDLRMRLKEAIG